MLFGLASTCMTGAVLAVYAYAGVDRETATFEKLHTSRLNIDGRVLLAIAILPLAALIIGKRGALLSSSGYLEYDGSSTWVSVGNSFTLPALMIVFFVWWTAAGPVRQAAALAALSWSVVLFASATRQLAAVPILYVVVATLLENAPRVRFRSVALAGTLAIIAMNLALTLRNGVAGEYGLLPFGQAVASDPMRFLIPDAPLVFGNVLFAVPLTAYVSNRAPFPVEYLTTSITPLLGSMTDWPTLLYELVVNFNTPYNALGQLANHGILTLCIYFVMAGIILAWADVRVRRWSGLLSALGFTVMFGLSLLFTLDVLQYQLRSTTRILYYVLTAAIVGSLIESSKLGRTQRSSSMRGKRR